MSKRWIVKAKVVGQVTFIVETDGEEPDDFNVRLGAEDADGFTSADLEVEDWESTTTQGRVSVKHAVATQQDGEEG